MAGGERSPPTTLDSAAEWGIRSIHAAVMKVIEETERVSMATEAGHIENRSDRRYATNAAMSYFRFSSNHPYLLPTEREYVETL